MAELPPGSVLLRDWTDSAGRVKYALTPTGEVWRLISGGGIDRKVELPRPIKPVMMGAAGRRYPFFKLGRRQGENVASPVSLMALMKLHFPESEAAAEIIRERNRVVALRRALREIIRSDTYAQDGGASPDRLGPFATMAKRALTRDRAKFV